MALRLAVFTNAAAFGVWQVTSWAQAVEASQERLEALADDDECLQEGGSCAVNALQRRGAKLSAAGADVEACLLLDTYFMEPVSAMKLAKSHEQASDFTSCHARCSADPHCYYVSYWKNSTCVLTGIRSYSLSFHGSDAVISAPKSCGDKHNDHGPKSDSSYLSGIETPSWRIHDTSDCNGRHEKYGLQWKAEGETFFDDFQFLTTSYTHGSEWYVNRTEAFRLGLVRPSKYGSVIKVGDVTNFFKRHSVMLHSAQAWRPDKGFILAMKYSHVPHGIGIWPSFWTVNSDFVWPRGGELDIMEYANLEENTISFHTDRHCQLNVDKMRRCLDHPAAEATRTADCRTNYSDNAMGCVPRQARRTGKWLSEHPGVIAMEWDDARIAVYHIPEKEIPEDLEHEKPEPSKWRKWLITHLAFDPATCVDIAKPQEIVITVALCGDAAGGPWRSLKKKDTSGWSDERFCWPGHIHEPATDCCTKFMTDPAQDATVKSNAFFHIDYVKVFEPEGAKLPKYAAGTFRNGGVGMNYPCMECGTKVFLTEGSGKGADKCCPGCGQGEMIWHESEQGGMKVCPSKEEYLKRVQDLAKSIVNGSVSVGSAKAVVEARTAQKR